MTWSSRENIDGSDVCECKGQIALYIETIVPTVVRPTTDRPTTRDFPTLHDRRSIKLDVAPAAVEAPDLSRHRRLRAGPGRAGPGRAVLGRLRTLSSAVADKYRGSDVVAAIAACVMP